MLEKAAQNLESDKQSGKGFDFKHYKKGPKATMTSMSETTPMKAVVAKKAKSNIKRSLHSLMGPPTLPNQPLKKGRKNTTNKTGKAKGRNTKRLRLDSLGFY